MAAPLRTAVVHLTAVARDPRVFEDPALAEWAFRAFERMPGTLFTVLMPDHPHLLHRTDDPDGLQAHFCHVLGHVSRRAGGGRRFWDVAAVQVLPNRDRVRRMVRYVALNRCRRGLDRDPLEARFSSYRDVLGLRVDPVVSAEELGAAVGRRRAGFAEWFHGYCSRDTRVAVEGTPMPVRAPPSEVARVGLREIAVAAAVATRGEVRDVQQRGPTRALFVALAWDQGWRDARVLADATGLGVRAVYRILRTVDPGHVDVAARCLDDPRLTPSASKRRDRERGGGVSARK